MTQRSLFAPSYLLPSSLPEETTRCRESIARSCRRSEWVATMSSLHRRSNDSNGLSADCPPPVSLGASAALARAERSTRVWAKKSRPMTQICLHVSRGRGFPRSTGKRGFVVKCHLVGQERVSQVASGETPFFGDVFSWEMTPALLKKLLDSTPAVKLNVYHFDSLTARGPTEPLGHVLLHLKTVSTAPPCVCVRAICICPSRPHPACCLLYTSPSPRDQRGSRMPSSA